MRSVIIIFSVFIFFNTNLICAQHKAGLTISEDGRSFIQNGDKGFFWMGDTAWELFHRLNKEEIDFYLKKRSSQGFNVIQAVVLSEINGLTKPNRYGEIPLTDKDPEKPNDAYFKIIDFTIEKAAGLDMYIALLPTWGRYWSEEKIFNKKNAYAYGKYLGQRYRDQWNIIWILGGDRIPETNEEYEIIVQMAKGLKAGDLGKHLITFHPSGNNTSLSFFQNEPWIDFHMSQSGHAHRDMPNFLYALNNNSSKPVKPYIDGEPRYEDLPVKFWEVKLKNDYFEHPYPVADSLTPYGYFNDFDVRRAAYWSVFSGAAGTTYGNGSIWCFWEKGRTSPLAIKHSWKKAMESPGGKQMQFLKKLIDLYGISNLRPDRSVITDNWSNCSNYQTALITKDNRNILVYIPEGSPVKISRKKLKEGNAIYKWYNPRNGAFSGKKDIAAPVIMKFTPPAAGKGNDWVLVIESI
jgi:hypothetical protein